MGKHQKHTKLTRTDFGQWARNEISLVGAPCGIIRELASQISTQLAPFRCIFIDESHNHDAIENSFETWTKEGPNAILNSKSVNKFDAQFQFVDYDLAIVNGNHFDCNSQIVILDSRKLESLERKANRLTNVIGFVENNTSQRPAFLENSNAPIFPFDAANSISELIRDNTLAPPPILGLVLAGGNSTRMHQDKTVLDYHGIPQREHLFNLMSKHCSEVYTSCRKEQVNELSNLNPLPDRLEGMGPFGAIISAFIHNPNTAWLVSAIDLPYVNDSCLSELTSSRDSSKTATAFFNAETEFPDPLLTIWEPKSYTRLLKFLEHGYSCPRKVLINSDCAVIKPSNRQWLQNINTPEQLKIVLEKKSAED